MYVHNIIYMLNQREGNLMSFVDNLRGVRKNHYLSQEKLTELLNVSRQALSKWEQGVMLE